MNYKDYKLQIRNDRDNSIKIELESDNSRVVKKLYSEIFDFYNERDFSGDVIFTWKSPSLVKNGEYIGKRDKKIYNNHFIGNLFPNYFIKGKRKYSLNVNRNGCMGDFPHDYFDIFLAHVAKYAYSMEIEFIKEYYPLKRAIQYKDNYEFFQSFKSFENYLSANYFTEIWEYMVCNDNILFSDMEFSEYQEVSLRLIEQRGILMINKLIK